MAGGWPRTAETRNLLDGLFYLVRTGCQWVQLPQEGAAIGLIAAVTNKGELRWMVLDCAGGAEPDLVARLPGPVCRVPGLLALDRLPAIRSAKVRTCLVGREVEMFSLPRAAPS